MKFRTFLFLAVCGGGAWYCFHGKDQPTDGKEDVAAMEQQIEEMQTKLEEAKERSGTSQEGETATGEKGSVSIASALAPRTKEVSRDTDEPVKSLSPAEAIKMLQKYGIIDELATGELVSTVDYRVGQTKEYKQNPISEISKDLMYHFMMYKDGVESLNDYPYIDKIIELYRRANTDQQELQAQGLAKLNDDLDALNNGLHEAVASALTGQKVPQRESRIKTLKRLPVRCLESFVAAGAKIANVEACRENIMAVNPVDKKLVAFLYTSEITPNRLNAANENGWTPLMNLARYATAEDCKKLIDAGADINARNKDGSTALMLATCNGEDGETVCDLLLKAGAGINEKNNDGWTPLMWAARNSTLGVCKIMIGAGADIDARKKDGSTSLMLATYNSERASAICDLLIMKGAEINVQNNDGDTALIWAIRNSTGEVCKKLIKAGATIDTTTPRGKQMLMQAACNAQTDVCEILINAGANVNEKGEDGVTALIFAAIAGNGDTAKLLLDAGADVNAITTANGDKKQTALDWVKEILAGLSNPFLGSAMKRQLQEDIGKNYPHAQLDYKGTLKLLEERGAKSITEINEIEDRDFGGGNTVSSNGHNQSQLMNLINRYIAARNDGNAYAIGDFYASQVKYKYSDYRVVSRDAVIRDALPWCKRWTMRNYELLAAGYNENTNTLEIIFRYNLMDAKGKTAGGYTKETWVLDTQGKIISWDEKLSKGGVLSLSPDYTKIH